LEKSGATLDTRLRQQFEEQKKAEGEDAVNALVLVKDAALAKAVADFFPNKRMTRSKLSLSDANGYRAGVIAGMGINLASQSEA
jgi:hypothetical protein